MPQELFQCRGDYQKQDRDAKWQWKAPGEKVKNGNYQEERINVNDKKTTREGCPQVRGTPVREKDLTSSEWKSNLFCLPDEFMHSAILVA